MEDRLHPALKTIIWALPDGSFELVSEKERFDTLRIWPRYSRLDRGDRGPLIDQARKLIGATRRVRVKEGPHAAAIEDALSRAGFLVLSWSRRKVLRSPARGG